MGTTRTERAIDEIDLACEEFEPTCDDIRLAWLAQQLDVSASVGNDFDALWCDR